MHRIDPDAIESHASRLADAALHMPELTRALKPGGTMSPSTAPYLSFAGTHLPKPVVTCPLHLLLGRRLLFGIFVWLARHTLRMLDIVVGNVEYVFVRDRRG